MSKPSKRAKPRTQRKGQARDKLSLHPLSVETALAAALKTGAPPKPVRKKSRGKRAG